MAVARNWFGSVRLSGAGPFRTRIGGYIVDTTSHIRASRTAAALGTVLAAATLGLGAAGPAQALTCAPGYDLAVAGNGAEFCAVRGDGGVAGGGSSSTGGGASTVPGQAAPIASGGGGGGVPGYQAPAAPYVPPAKAPAYVAPAPAAPAPAYNPGPAPVQNQAPNGYTPSAPNRPVKGMAGSAADSPVIDGVPAAAPAAKAAPAQSHPAVTPSATPTAHNESPRTTPLASPSVTATPPAAAIQSEQVAQTDNGTAPGFIAGSLGVLVVAAVAVYWWRLRKTRRQPG